MPKNPNPLQTMALGRSPRQKVRKSGRTNRIEPIIYDKTLYKMRRKIEILFGKIKENRRLSMRFDKADVAFLGFIALALIKIIIN